MSHCERSRWVDGGSTRERDRGSGELVERARGNARKRETGSDEVRGRESEYRGARVK